MTDGKPRTKALLDTCFRQVEYAGCWPVASRPDEAGRVVDFLLSQQFQEHGRGEHVRLPGARGRRAARGLDRRRHRCRRSRLRCRARRSRRTGSSGSSSGADSSRARSLCWPFARRVSGRLLRVAGGRDHRARVRRRWRGQVLTKASTWQLAGFTVGQAAASTVLSVLAGLPIAFVLARVQAAGHRTGPDHRAGAVCAADGGGRAGFPRAVAGRRGAARSCWPTPSSTWRWWPARSAGSGRIWTVAPRRLPARWARPRGRRSAR